MVTHQRGLIAVTVMVTHQRGLIAVTIMVTHQRGLLIVTIMVTHQRGLLTVTHGHTPTRPSYCDYHGHTSARPYYCDYQGHTHTALLWLMIIYLLWPMANIHAALLTLTVTYLLWPMVPLGLVTMTYHRHIHEAFKLQALVYDILPSITAVFSHSIGSRKLSANEQFFVGVPTVVSLLQTTQIISDVYFITDHVAYASSNKIKIV